MSRIGRFKTEIVSVNEGVLKRAMEVLAKRRSLKLTDGVRDYYRRRTHCLALDTGTGFGVEVRGGRLEFIYDAYTLGKTAGELKQELLATYTSIVAALAVRSMGFEVTTSETEGGVLIVGRSDG